MKTLLVVACLCGVTPLAAAQHAPSASEAQESSNASVTQAAPRASEAQESSNASQAAADSPKNEDYFGRYPTRQYIDAVIERTRHPSLGYGAGRHGDGLVVGLRYDQPVTRTGWGYLQFYHYTNFGPLRGPFDPVLQFGLNFITRSKVILGIFRIYAGGGLFAGWRPRPSCRNPLDSGDIGQAYASAGREPVLDPQTKQPIAPPTRGDGKLVDPSLRAVSERIADMAALCEKQKDPLTFTGSGIGGIEFFPSPIRSYFIELSGGAGAQKNGRWTDMGLIVHVGSQFYF